VDYKGRISSDRIEIKTISRIPGYKGHEDQKVYRFEAVTFPAK
jgi:hypothetical protein